MDKRLTDFRSMSAFIIHTYNDIFLTGLKKKAHNICFPSNVCSREMEAEIWLRENMKNRNSFILTCSSKLLYQAEILIQIQKSH